MAQSCLDCGQRSDRVFCDSMPHVLHEFDGIKSIRTFPRGTVLFGEGQPAQGVLLLCLGRVRLSVCSENGRRMNLRVVRTGEVLGLSAVLCGGSFEVTAEALEPVQVAEVGREDLLQFLHAHRDVCMQVVNLLSEDLHLAYDRVRAVGLLRTRHANNHSAQAH